MKNKPFRLRRKAPEGYLTITQTAEYMGISVKTVRRYIQCRGLPAEKPAGMYLVNRQELDNWIRQNGK